MKCYLKSEANGDGMTSRQELKKAEGMFLVSTHSENNHKMLISSQQVNVVDKAGLAGLDKNGDGKLTHHELNHIYLATFHTGDEHSLMLKTLPGDIFALATSADSMTFKDHTEAALIFV